MAIVSALLLFCLATAALAGSGHFLVRALVKIGTFLRIREFTLAFILMAFATSLPELFVGITSALASQQILSLGNVIGSNIVDVTLILGIAILLARSSRIKTEAVRKDIWLVLGIAALPILLLLDGRLGRLDAAILLAVFLVYMFRLLSERRSEAQKAKDSVSHWQFLGYILLFMAALAGLFISANFVVRFGSALAIDIGIPEILIGLVLVAIGTSLPELAFEAQAALKKHGELALGDALGSVVANSTLVLGITAALNPIVSPLATFLTAAIFMLLVLFVFLTFAQTTKRLSWQVGISLIFLYIFFLIVEFSLRGLGLS